MDIQVKKNLDEANKLIFVKKYHEADKLLREILSTPEGKNDLLVHLRHIELAAKLNNLPELVRGFEAMAETPENGLAGAFGLVMAQMHEETLTPVEALERFQEIMKRVGPNAACYYGVAFSLEMQGNLERAIYNYQQSIALDSEWYPSYFGLSQLHYQQGDSKNGDHYFYLFENAAPYNVYGNFDTHRKLSQAFIATEEYTEAEAAIKSLGEWWLDHKGYVPQEIQIYENLVISHMHDLRGNEAQSLRMRQTALTIAEEVLSDPNPKEAVLYFVAKALEEHSELELSYKFYKKILRTAGSNPAMVQRIGSQFLSMGQFKLAKELFDEAYEVHPDNAEIRFCLLVCKLRLAGVNVEEYLIGKERLKQLQSSDSDRVELLALLHSLLAKFDQDAEVHQHIGDIYLRMGNVDRSARHFKKMYELDGRSRGTSLKFVAFSMQHGDIENAKKILDDISKDQSLPAEDDIELSWLKSNYFARVHQYEKSQEYLGKVLSADPWNVSYLVQEIINLTRISTKDEELSALDSVVKRLTNMDESDLKWTEYDAQTAKLEAAFHYGLVYARRKLRYLYSNGDEQDLRLLVSASSQFDPARGTFDFMRLLNTNFDSALIYWALGFLYKELWQLEVSRMWFEQALLHTKISLDQKGKIYVELADCYTWLGTDFQKAIEYAKFALEMGQKVNEKISAILAHAYLKSGQVRQAKMFLDAESVAPDPETLFLRGLLQYRNGARTEANKIWKPLLTVKSENLRFHNIKQEILKFYFEGAPYLKVN